MSPEVSSSHPIAGAKGWLAGLAMAVAVLFVLYLAAGSSDPGRPFYFRLTPAEVLTELFRGPQGDTAEAPNVIVWQIRLLRGLACLLCGGLLGMVGSAFQALFRNPLADPYIVGVSSGAAAGGALALTLGIAGFLGGLGLMACAFGGGIVALSLVLALGRFRGALDVQKLLLSGVVVGAMLAALLSMILLMAGQDTNQVLRWLLGSATPMFWNRIVAMALALSIGGPILLLQAKRLNVLASGEDAAKRLGVDVARLKPTVLGVGAAMTAVTVGSMGIIGFLGLVAPHISRRLLGVDWRTSLLGSMLVGMGLLLLADIVAQRAMPGAELPVGVVTALLGAPFLLLLLRKEAE